MNFIYAYELDTGCFSEEEAELLYKAAKMAPADGVFLELGANIGKSLVTLAKADERRIVHTVDSYQHWYAPAKLVFEETVKRHKLSNVVLHCDTFSNVASLFTEPIALLHEDGTPHTKESVDENIELFWDKILPGGIIVFHDSNDKWFTVHSFLNEVFPKKYNVEFVSSVEGTWGLSVWKKKL